MNEGEFRVLHSQYCKDPASVIRPDLYALIDYLHKELVELEEKYEDLSNSIDREPEPLAMFERED